MADDEARHDKPAVKILDGFARTRGNLGGLVGDDALLNAKGGRFKTRRIEVEEGGGTEEHGREGKRCERLERCEGCERKGVQAMVPREWRKRSKPLKNRCRVREVGVPGEVSRIPRSPDKITFLDFAFQGQENFARKTRSSRRVRRPIGFPVASAGFEPIGFRRCSRPAGRMRPGRSNGKASAQFQTWKRKCRTHVGYRITNAAALPEFPAFPGTEIVEKVRTWLRIPMNVSANEA